MTGTSSKTKQNDASVCTCVNLRRASRAITRIYDTLLEPADLKITQYSALANIIQYGPLTASKLSLILTLDRTTLVRNLKSLEACGYIMSSATSDSRERAISITESGRIAVESARPYWRMAQKLVENSLSPEAMRQISSIVTTLEGIAAAGNAGVEIHNETF